MRGVIETVAKARFNEYTDDSQSIVLDSENDVNSMVCHCYRTINSSLIILVDFSSPFHGI